MSRPIIEAITEKTLPEFAGFLKAHMRQEHTLAEWIEGLSTSWPDVQRPNYGFLMRDEGQLVGGIGAIYSRRIIHGQAENFCNITSWCVLDAYRKYGMQLAIAMVSQPGYHFTDFSPTKIVGGVLQFLKFKPLDDDSVAIIANLPIPFWRGTVLVSPKSIEQELTGQAATIWRDHAGFPWLRHLLLGKPGNWCHVIYKRGQFKGLPCAKIVYLGNSHVFQSCFRRLAWHFFCHGMVSTHVERRFVSQLPWPSRTRSGFNRKVYLSSTLTDADIDYLYSESVALNL